MQDSVKYIDALQKEGFYLAALIVFGQFVESGVEDALELITLHRRACKLCKVPDPYKGNLFELGASSELKSLGKKVKRIEAQFGESFDLEPLRTFRDDYRNKAVHEAFNGTKTIEDWEGIAREFFASHKVPELLGCIGGIRKFAFESCMAIYNDAK